MKSSIGYHFNTVDESNREKFEYRLQQILRSELNGYQRIIVLCIGSDRFVGDCLGPLIGHKLAFGCNDNIIVYGTLESTVNAVNFRKVIDSIYNKYYNPFIIAIDSSIGERCHIGSISLREGGISPGIGFGKMLPKVGHISITGIVAQSGITFEGFIHTVRMRLVVQVADFIVTGLLNTFHDMNLISF